MIELTHCHTHYTSSAMIVKHDYAGVPPAKSFAGGWLSAPTPTKPCDSCKMSPARLFCRADSAFLCAACDGRVHGANKLASRHERVLLCEVCEQSPAIVTCKADAAALCAACDADIHSANSLAHRHQRLPVAPFFHSPAIDDDSSSIFDDVDVGEETEEAPWLLPALLPNPKIEEYNSGDFFFSDVDPYVDLDYDAPIEHRLVAMDSIVPVQTNSATYFDAGDYHRQKPSMDTFAAPSLLHSISSSSMEVAVVPDGTETTAISGGPGGSVVAAAQLTGVEREARVMRYREKRKNRRFEKTIRYASRKAYAETRPRIKGRFVKRVSGDGDGDDHLIFSATDAAEYGVVPSF